ncbi:MAG TPA: hypothetical protein VFQ07_07415 [Candidatus Polarisedimenticolia bacterium]|nr:hypothetical protein [Candidatus Polarisedimenticolia bacterium]
MVVLRSLRRLAAGRRSPAPILLAALALAACGGGGYGRGKGDPLPGPGARLDPIYDVTITFPQAEVIAGGITLHGIVLDLAFTFVDATVRDADPRFRAPADVVRVEAGGIPQAFVVTQPLVVEGTIEDGAMITDSFGAIQFASANLVLALSGAIAPGARRIAGTAALFGTSEPGTFNGVLRRRYLVAGTDLQAIGEAATVEVRYDREIVLHERLETISADPIARVEDGRPIVVNRYSYDNLQGLDPHAAFTTAFEHSTGNGSNPHDVVVLSDHDAGAPFTPPAPGEESAGVAFVTRYEPPYDDVALFDLDDGGLIQSIDLRPLARNPDHLPRADQMAWSHQRLWVTLQDANASFSQFMNGRVAVIDPVLRRVEDVIDLAGQNPFEALEVEPVTGLLYVGCAGLFARDRDHPPVLSGGVEAIDPVQRRSLGLVIDDDALGGNVSGLAIPAPDRGFAVVTDAAFHNTVMMFDPQAGTVLGPVYDTSDRLAALASDGQGWVLIADTSFTTPRLLILDGSTGAILAAVPLRLPPQSIAVLTRPLP